MLNLLSTRVISTRIDRSLVVDRSVITHGVDRVGLKTRVSQASDRELLRPTLLIELTLILLDPTRSTARRRRTIVASGLRQRLLRNQSLILFSLRFLLLYLRVILVLRLILDLQLIFLGLSLSLLLGLHSGIPAPEHSRLPSAPTRSASDLPPSSFVHPRFTAACLRSATDPSRSVPVS